MVTCVFAPRGGSFGTPQASIRKSWQSLCATSLPQSTAVGGLMDGWRRRAQEPTSRGPGRCAELRTTLSTGGGCGSGCWR